MACFASQYVCDPNSLPIKSFILVGSLDYDSSVDLDTSIESSRFEIGEDGSTFNRC